MAKPSSRPRRGQTVGRLIAASLADVGVKWAFTVPGESFLGVLDALPGAGIRVIATRHEGGAAFMAEAVGQLTGAPAAVLGTRAVGAANMSIGIHTARQNSTPLVALVGQVRRAFLGREAFQEVDQVESFGRLAKWAGQIDAAASAADIVGEGLSAMLSGRPGPVLFSLPEDVLDEPVPARARVLVDVARPSAPTAEAVREIVALLTNAARPAILAGGGVVAARAQDDLVRFSELAEVPVIAAWRRPTAFPNDHPHFLGVTGYGAASTVRPRLEKADALLVLGSRLNEVSSFDYRIPGPRTKWAHVDLEPRSEARAGLKPATIALPADAGAFLGAAIEALRGYKAPKERAAAIATDRADYLAASTFGEDRERQGHGVDPASVITTLQRILAEDALLTCDAGNFGLWMARGFRFGRQNSFLGLTSGAMGYGLPAAIAASLCEPTRQVVALCGDGGFAMTMNELETAVRAGAKPVVLVFDNRRYGTIAMHQANEGRGNVATDLGTIDFAAMARAMGAQGGRVGRDVEFEPALRDALAAGRPAVIHLEIDPRWVTPDRYE